jgi:hypothetical protein
MLGRPPPMVGFIPRPMPILGFIAMPPMPILGFIAMPPMFMLMLPGGPIPPELPREEF